MSHINNPSSSIDSNEAALLTSLEGLASGTGQAIVKSGSTTLGLVTFGDLTKAQADTYYYPLSTNPAGYLTDAPSDGSTYGRLNGAWAVAGGGTSLWQSGIYATDIISPNPATDRVVIDPAGTLIDDGVSALQVNGFVNITGPYYTVPDMDGIFTATINKTGKEISWK